MLKDVGIIFNPFIEDPYLKQKVIHYIKFLRSSLESNLILSSKAWKVVSHSLGEIKNLKIKAEESEVFSESQSIISIGGDGTLIYCSRRVKDSGKPIYGLNAGTVGKLCAFDKKSYKSLPKASTYPMNRPVYSIKRGYDSAGLSQLSFINDLYLRSFKLTEFSLHLPMNIRFAKFKASGLIISTPFGSTGMNKSFGGPIVSPNLKSLIITPVGVLNAPSRSFVIDPSVSISFDGKTQVTGDGVSSTSMFSESAYFQIIKAYDQTFMTPQEYTFF